MDYDYFVDVKNMCCFGPIQKITQTLKIGKAGEVMLIEANKISLLRDIPSYCAQTKHSLLKTESENGIYRFWVKILDKNKTKI